jgi:hypothetical protein
MVKSHTVDTRSKWESIMGARRPLPPVAPPLEDAVYAAMEDEKKRAPAGLSFAPVYAFTTAVAQMARAQERQAIINELPRRPRGKTKEWNEGFDAAVSAFIGLLVRRSMI